MRMRLRGRTGVVAVVLGAMVALCIVPVEGVLAATRCVNPGGTGGCYSSIQDAINAAASGDTIAVAAGTYHEDVTIVRSVTIQGTAGAVIDGSPGSGGPRLTVPSGVIAEVSGLTITSALATIGSGGIANNGVLALSACTISDNRNTPLTGALGGGIRNTATLTVSDCMIRGNQARGGGGAIANSGTLTVTATVFSGNTSFSGGGGIFNDTAGTLTVTESTFSTNGGGGGGGGIENWGTAAVVRSTLDGNSAQHGGGIVNIGRLTLTNATLSGNTASGSTDQGRGGGIANDTGVVTVTAATLSKNTAAQGGGIANGSGSVILANTIVAGNTASSAPDLFGGITSQNDNLFGTTSGAAITLGSGDIVTSSPLLGPLGSNSGPTQTIPLLAGSPAIGAGDPTVCANAPVGGVDQRGFPRPPTRCSIGAFEALLALPTITVSASPSTIWPPNHTDVPVTVSVQVTAGGAPLSTPAFVLTSVQVAGGSASDITGFAVGQPSVRGTVKANKDAVYTLTYTATDQAGNRVTATATITVLHDQGQGGGNPNAAPASRPTGGMMSGAGSGLATPNAAPGRGRSGP